MKKFISMVMAATMVVSLVPATAFAANEVTAKVVDAYEVTVDQVEEVNGKVIAGPQLQMKIKDVDTKQGAVDKYELKLYIDGADVDADDFKAANVTVLRTEDNNTVNVVDNSKDVKVVVDEDDDQIEITINEGKNAKGDVIDLKDGDVITIDLNGTLKKTKVGHEATVKVTGDFGTVDEKVYAAIVDKGITAEVDDVVDIAAEEVATLEEITIEPAAGDVFGDVADNADELTLKLNSGFEFAKEAFTIEWVGGDGDGQKMTVTPNRAKFDDSKITFALDSWETDAKELKITGLVVEATSADAGDVATLTVKIDGLDSVKLEVATVVDFKVVMSVDEEEDVPVYYNGVDSKNTGLTVDDDHESLEVTIEETFAGAWGHHKDWTLTLPEGVHVVALEAEDENGTWGLDEDDKTDTMTARFAAAYKEGDHESFVFEKRSFLETDPENDDPHEITFVMTLTADPDFVGDVVLTLEGDAVDTQEVTIAKFVPAYTIKAEQNDMKIDYRYTEVGTTVSITEAEAGLWAEDMVVTFVVDKDYIEFEDDVTVTVDEESGMEVDEAGKNDMGFKVTEESDEVPATITFSDIELFMQRNIPAGPYDLEVASATTIAAFESEALFAPDEDGCRLFAETSKDKDGKDVVLAANHDEDKECYVYDVCDYSEVVKEAWINVVTAGREADDASFTTKVVVPVGEAYIIAGETQVALDVPAYVNAAGYTMLPVRAVAVALGINTQNVLWDQATKTVTILYGQRIITMQVGAKVVYVNGSAIPASASVEIVDGRTFLPMRDLATALGVTDITWDAATKTATLNGNA